MKKQIKKINNNFWKRIKLNDVFNTYKNKYKQTSFIQGTFIISIIIITVLFSLLASYEVKQLVNDNGTLPLDIQNAILNGDELTPEQEDIFVKNTEGLSYVLQKIFIYFIIYLILFIGLKVVKDSIMWNKLTKEKINYNKKIIYFGASLIVFFLCAFLIALLTKIENPNLLASLFFIMLVIFSFFGNSFHPFVFEKWKKINKNIAKKISYLFLQHLVLVLTCILSTFIILLLASLLMKLSVVLAMIILIILILTAYVVIQNLFFIWQIEVVRQK